MPRLRIAVAVAILGGSIAAAPAGPAGGTLHDVSAKAKQVFDAARADLMGRGKKARAAAEAGDVPGWKAANDAYVQKLREMVEICESNVNDVTTLSTDLADTGTKPVVAVLSSYFDVAPSMLKARLQFKAYANLADRMSPTDRLVILKALAPLYLSE